MKKPGTSRKQKEEIAYHLYMQSDLSQKDIAESVGVNPNTITNWIKKGEWEITKAANTVTRGKQIVNFLLQIKELNEAIAERENKYPTSQEADVITKVTNAIEKLENKTTLSHYIEVFIEFHSFLMAHDKLTLSKSLVNLQNEFIQLKAKELKQ